MKVLFFKYWVRFAIRSPGLALSGLLCFPGLCSLTNKRSNAGSELQTSRRSSWTHDLKQTFAPRSEYDIPTYLRSQLGQRPSHCIIFALPRQSPSS
ncbi:hypothetical protein B0H17DRAFT_1101847 [Mycena rosella]|uniref:Uncharacterized protein n=1 Tax=Mycena rosella TaxID=1033263 RepID=A0AAD7G296_MYCRO|nr:hypothetical protein B0H17DRAFT_1101847 [Mycena rosella]